MVNRRKIVLKWGTFGVLVDDGRDGVNDGISL